MIDRGLPVTGLYGTFETHRSMNQLPEGIYAKNQQLRLKTTEKGNQN
jgi:hypothetical protein